MVSYGPVLLWLKSMPIQLLVLVGVGLACSVLKNLVHWIHKTLVLKTTDCFLKLLLFEFLFLKQDAVLAGFAECISSTLSSFWLLFDIFLQIYQVFSSGCILITAFFWGINTFFFHANKCNFVSRTMFYTLLVWQVFLQVSIQYVPVHSWIACKYRVTVVQPESFCARKDEHHLFHDLF